VFVYREVEINLMEDLSVNVEGEEGQETDWESLFRWNDSPFFGYCDTVDDANDVVQEYSYRTSTSFTVSRSTKDFGMFNLAGRPIIIIRAKANEAKRDACVTSVFKCWHC